jgi:hypothetical protein
MSDASRIKALLRERVADLAQYLFPNGKREGNHWCVGDVTGTPGKSFKICIAGPKAGLWGDFAESEKHSRSLLDLWMAARNVDFKTAWPEAAEWLGCSLHGSNDTRKSAVDWDACVEAFTEKHVEWLAKCRGYSVEFCSWLKEDKLVGLYNGRIAFPVHDRAEDVVAVHYRLKDRTWRYYPEGAKVCPLVIGELAEGGLVFSFESYFDAFSFMDVFGERNGIIVTRGAGNGALIAGLIPLGSTVYAWKQNDELKNGKRAGDGWLKDVATRAATKVLWPKTPEQFKDLNDWTRAGATYDDLYAAITTAEVICEAVTNAAIKTDTSQLQTEGLEPGLFPLEALNPVMREIVGQSAEVYQIEPELPAMAGVATLAGAMGKDFVVTGAVSGRETHCNVYVIPGAPKSYGKNAAATMAAPLRDASNELAKSFRETERPELLTEKKISEKREKTLVRNCTGETLIESGRQEMQRELARIQKRLDEIEPLLGWPPTYLVGNATSAALTEILKRNGHTIFSFSPEAGELVRIALGKFTKDRAADFDLYLSGYTVESARETRISRGDSGDLVPCISVLWFCQPFLLRELFTNEEALERGLTARVLPFIVEHDNIPEDDGVVRFVAESVRRAWDSLVRQVLEYRESAQTIQCSLEAREVFRAFHNEAVRLRNGKYRAIEGELGRWRENAIRIAGGQCVADALSKGEDDKALTLTGEQAERGVKIARWSHLHSLIMLNKGLAERQWRLVETLQDLVRRYGGTATLRDLRDRHGFASDEVKRLATEYPHALSIQIKKPATGRPSEVLVIPNRQRRVA